MLRMGRHNVIPSDFMGVKTFAPKVAAAAGNGLLNALIAYWPGDEESGNLLDAHTNGLDLTDVNSVTNNTGKVYATARQYTVATSEYHKRNDDAYLSTGDVDFTIAAWCYLDSKGSNRALVSKWTAIATRREYMVWFNNALDRFEFLVRNVGDTANTRVQASTFGSPSTGTWYFVCAWHDATANTVSISINNGSADSKAHAGVPDTASDFMVGATDLGLSPWNGRIGPTAFWKGSGGVLSAAQRTALYNSGDGLAYASFTA